MLPENELVCQFTPAVTVNMKWWLLLVLQVTYAQDVQAVPFLQRIEGLVYDTRNCTVAPLFCPNKNISFYLYTRSTINFPHLLDPSDIDTIRNASFVAGAPLKVLIHGYTGHKDYAPNGELREAYFRRGEYNVISIDWSQLCRSPCYVEATYNVIVVGQCSARLLDLIYANVREVTLENTHVIGFSLGAHVAGNLASRLTSGRLPRLTGLDAAMPLFDKILTQASEMLDSKDAAYVDAYHTNEGQRGRISTFGTVDFYVNNGAFQPGCNCNSSCNHYRSVQFFAETINSDVGLFGFKCYSWYLAEQGFCNVNDINELVNIGENVPFNLSGVYYSFTNDKPPFAISSHNYYDVVSETKRVDENCPLLII